MTFDTWVRVDLTHIDASNVIHKCELYDQECPQDLRDPFLDLTSAMDLFLMVSEIHLQYEFSNYLK